jgi:N-acetyl-gamma-glutamyl-phosphate reductase
MAERARIGILGASGYTGAELVRLLLRHPGAEIALLAAGKQAGKGMDEVFPQFAGFDLPRLESVESVGGEGLDVVFAALPHGHAHQLARRLKPGVRLIDLSADFRLPPEVYAEAYGIPHGAPELQAGAAYGLTEWNRDAVAGAGIVANPGCYPTASLLPLIPLLRAGLVDPSDIVIDAKSGVSGAGRGESQANLYAEVTEGIHAYGVGRHRHMPELARALDAAAGGPVGFSFTPHLMPMSRGMLATIYVRGKAGDLHNALAETYAAEPFLRILPPGATPQTRHVRGANLCLVGVVPDRREGRAIIVSAIDNLVKGASGQAVQNMNLMLGLPEVTGLEGAGLFP